MEMRDRSGFDIDGRGESDRGPTAFEPGLLLTYTDEAHGYGNVGTDNPPAQTPLDSVPEPESDTPNLNDATFNASGERSSYTDSPGDAARRQLHRADPRPGEGQRQRRQPAVDVRLQLPVVQGRRAER
jgi:hypothetical protein